MASLSDQNARLTEFENKVAMFSQEIERLNMALKNTLEEKKELISRNGKLEFDLESLRNSESRQVNQLRAEYEGQLAMLKQEVERLTRDRKEFDIRYGRLEAEANADRAKLIQYTQEF